MTETLNKRLYNHLMRDDGQEDLCFAFYNPSVGEERYSGLIIDLLLPKEGDRNVHGNVSFNSAYLDRVTSYALSKGLGIAFLHSHPCAGWQSMSSDDIIAEQMLAPRVKAITGLALLGLTLGTNGTWSARFWKKTGPKKYVRKWCETVRVVGKGIRVSFNEKLVPAPIFGEEYWRTVSAWSEGKQADIARLRVGIVGLGSVGSIIAEALYNTGIQNITMIDFDLLGSGNLDRWLGSKRQDVGKLKVDLIAERLRARNINPKTKLNPVAYSISENMGLKGALDCDILFSGVDRPSPRFILDCIAKANYIPVIDGGIDASINKSLTNLDQARWKSHTVGPERICMQCLGQYQPEDVALEESGYLEESTYIEGLPEDHFIKRGENVFAFSLDLAGKEMQQFLSFVLQPRGQYYGPKEYNFNSGNIDFDFPFHCKPGCSIDSLLGMGDLMNASLISKHPTAEKYRKPA